MTSPEINDGTTRKLEVVDDKERYLEAFLEEFKDAYSQLSETAERIKEELAADRKKTTDRMPKAKKNEKYKDQRAFQRMATFLKSRKIDGNTALPTEEDIARWKGFVAHEEGERQKSVTEREAFLSGIEQDVPAIHNILVRMEAVLPRLTEAWPNRVDGPASSLERMQKALRGILDEVDGKSTGGKKLKEDLEHWKTLKAEIETLKGYKRLQQAEEALARLDAEKYRNEHPTVILGEDLRLKQGIVDDMEAKLSSIDVNMLAQVPGSNLDIANMRLAHLRSLLEKVKRQVGKSVPGTGNLLRRDLAMISEYERGEGVINEILRQIEQVRVEQQKFPEQEKLEALTAKLPTVLEMLAAVDSVDEAVLAKVDNISLEDAVDKKGLIRQVIENIKFDIENNVIDGSALDSDIATIVRYESGEGVLRNLLKAVKRDEVKTEIEPAPLETPPEAISQREIKYVDAVEKKMESLGFTYEMLAQIPGLNPEKDDAPDAVWKNDAKVLWMLEKFEGVKLRRIKNRATEQFEKDDRENRAKRFVDRGLKEVFKRKFGRSAYIKDIEMDLGREKFDFEAYKKDLGDLAHLAHATPEMVLTKREGKTVVMSEYLSKVQGIDQTKLDPFNQAATAYSNLPPKHEWKKYAPRELKEYELIEKRYEKARKELLSEIPKNYKTEVAVGAFSKKGRYSKIDAEQLVNMAEFSVKMHQNINRYPSAELELKKLAESRDWSRTWETIKAQLNIGAVPGIGGGAIGSAAAYATLRWSVNSALVMTGASLALPAVALGFGIWKGRERGGKKAEERLMKEEELMRLGMLEKKSKDTDKNFVHAGALMEKIVDLDALIKMDYAEYVQTGRGKDKKRNPVSPEEFEARKLVWAEMLDTRLKYTMKKLDDEKIAFGKDEESLERHYMLTQAVIQADNHLKTLEKSATLRKHKDGTVRSRENLLNYILNERETKINESRQEYITKHKKIGGITGMAFSALGFGVMHGIITPMFVDEVAEETAKAVNNIKAKDYLNGRELTAALMRSKEEIEAGSTTSSVLSSLEHTGPYPDDRVLDAVSLSPKIEELTVRSNVAQFAPAPVESAEVKPEPFTYKFPNETQSRKDALAKFFENQGMDKSVASDEANRYMQKLTNEKGQKALGFVHKGETITITDNGGKITMIVNRPNAIPLTFNKSAPNFRAPALPEKLPEDSLLAPELFKKDEVLVTAKNTMRGVPGFDMKDVPVTSDDIEKVRDTSSSSASFEATTSQSSTLSTNVVDALQKSAEKIDAYKSLTESQKDQFLYQMTVKKIVEQARQEMMSLDPVAPTEFYKKIGIASGNPFDGKSAFVIPLNTSEGKMLIAEVMDEIKNNAVSSEATDFRKYMGKLVRQLRNVNPNFLDQGLIDSTLIRLKSEALRAAK